MPNNEEMKDRLDWIYDKLTWSKDKLSYIKDRNGGRSNRD